MIAAVIVLAAWIVGLPSLLLGSAWLLERREARR